MSVVHHKEFIDIDIFNGFSFLAVNDEAVKSISLHFVGSMNLLNYDEYSLNFNFEREELKLPSTWQSEWPDLSESALCTMMSSLLHQACIVQGGHVCINALENDMVCNSVFCLCVI